MSDAMTQPQLNQETMPALAGTEARFYRFRVGNIDCVSLSDGAIRVPMGPPQPGKPTEFRLVPLSCLMVTLPKTGKIVLMDSGFGFDPQMIGRPMRSDGRLMESLSMAGGSPELIDFLLISHLDPDHVGGLLYDCGSKQFPNAIYYAGAEEVAFWNREAIDLGYSPAPEPVKRERLSASGRLLRVAGKSIRTFQAGEEVVPGVGSILLPGHTPGQVGFIIEGEPESLLYTADSVANSVVSIETPHVHNPMDLDPETGVQSRQILIKLLLEKNCQNFSPHFPWPSVGRLERAEDRAVWKSALPTMA